MTAIWAACGLALAVGRVAGAAGDPLPSWRDGAAKQRIVSFVRAVTTREGKDRGPPSERIAVFDNDGTLGSEQPMYVQLAFALDRVKALAPQHPEWKDAEPFKSVLAGDLPAVAAGGEHALAQIGGATHAGMTTDLVGSSIKARYEVRDGTPVIVRLPEVDFVDDKAGKPGGIQKVIGRRPIASFGNSDDDCEMLEWATSAQGPRLGMLVHHDDAEREYAYDRDSPFGRLARGLDEGPRRGWTIVSMRQGWARVFPEAGR